MNLSQRAFEVLTSLVLPGLLLAVGIGLLIADGASLTEVALGCIGMGFLMTSRGRKALSRVAKAVLTDDEADGGALQRALATFERLRVEQPSGAPEVEAEATPEPRPPDLPAPTARPAPPARKARRRR